jgi:hypothetical protein
MYSREQIIEELKRVAAKLGTTSLKEADFELNSTIPMSTVRFYLGSWHRALQEAGLEYHTNAEKVKSKRHTAPEKNEPGNDEDLLKELLRLHEDSGQVPTLALIREKSKFADRHYRERWRSIAEAFDLAQEKYSPKKVAPTLEKYQLDKETLLKKNQTSVPDEAKPSTDPPVQPDNDMRHETQETVILPTDFKGFKLPPAGKLGLLYLFGMIAPQLGFVVAEIVEDSLFPFAIGKRSPVSSKESWYTVRLRFEYLSSQYTPEFDSLKKGSEELCREILVCWEHDDYETSHEVLELKSTIKELYPQE